jgi:hypothetical protein
MFEVKHFGSETCKRTGESAHARSNRNPPEKIVARSNHIARAYAAVAYHAAWQMRCRCRECGEAYLCHGRSFSHTGNVPHLHEVLLYGVLPVVKHRPKGTAIHLLEAQREDTVGHASRHEAAGDVYGSAAGRAVVVDVYDRDACHANLVRAALAASRIPKAVAGNHLIGSPQSTFGCAPNSG